MLLSLFFVEVADAYGSFRSFIETELLSFQAHCLSPKVVLRPTENSSIEGV